MGSARRIPIAGMGSICALGRNIRDISSQIYQEAPAPVSASAIHPEALPYPFFASEMVQRRHSARDTLQLALKAAAEAMENAGWENLHGAAVVVGTTSGTALHFLESQRKRMAGADVRDYLECNPALSIGSRFGATGPCITLSNACVSGADAIGLGMDLINGGAAGRVLCGGADAFSLVAHTGFVRLKIYDERPCRPFDRERNGLNQGEGAAFLCLQKDRASPLGFIAGYGAASDAWHLTAPHPEGRGLRKAIAKALGESGTDIEDLAFVNAHGTGTRTNDLVEGKVLRGIAPAVPLWASKGMTGHTLGAAGALEAVLTLLALNRRSVPASAGFAKPDQETGASPTLRETGVERKYALSVSLGFGGGNSALVLEAANEG